MLSLVMAAAAAAVLTLGPSAEANPFKDFGRAVKQGAKEVGHATKEAGHALKTTFKGGSGARSGKRAGGHHHGGGGGKHHRGGGGRHHRRR
jgi:hypothetical protein